MSCRSPNSTGPTRTTCCGHSREYVTSKMLPWNFSSTDMQLFGRKLYTPRSSAVYRRVYTLRAQVGAGHARNWRRLSSADFSYPVTDTQLAHIIARSFVPSQTIDYRTIVPVRPPPAPSEIQMQMNSCHAQWRNQKEDIFLAAART